MLLSISLSASLHSLSITLMKYLYHSFYFLLPLYLSFNFVARIVSPASLDFFPHLFHLCFVCLLYSKHVTSTLILLLLYFQRISVFFIQFLSLSLSSVTPIFDRFTVLSFNCYQVTSALVLTL